MHECTHFEVFVVVCISNLFYLCVHSEDVITDAGNRDGGDATVPTYVSTCVLAPENYQLLM